MEALLQNNIFFRYRKHTYLRRKDHISVRSNIISGRTKTVSVKNCAHYISIRKQNRSRAVPGFHHCRIVLIEIPFFLGNCIIVCPGFRNRDHNRKRKLHTAHNKKFQCVVKHGGIRTVSVHHRKYGLDVLFPSWDWYWY